MNDIVAIQLPLPHVRSVNAWLLRGDPLTLIDTGPRADGALAALEDGLRREGLRVEDIELEFSKWRGVVRAGSPCNVFTPE